MSHFLSLKPAEVIRVLERNGFRRITKRKKHRIYTDGTRESAPATPVFLYIDAWRVKKPGGKGGSALALFRLLTDGLLDPPKRGSYLPEVLS